jgi:hypothetical protein
MVVQLFLIGHHRERVSEWMEFVFLHGALAPSIPSSVGAIYPLKD